MAPVQVAIQTNQLVASSDAEVNSDYLKDL